MSVPFQVEIPEGWWNKGFQNFDFYVTFLQQSFSYFLSFYMA